MKILILVSRMRLKFAEGDGVDERPFAFRPVTHPLFLPEFLKLVFTARKARLIFVSNPQFADFIFCFVVKLVFGRKKRVIMFDLILKRPVSAKDRILRPFKMMLLKAVDIFACIHKDLSGYARYFEVSEERCRYIPFKPNNADILNEFTPIDGKYVVSLGASQRDHALLIEALTGTDIPLKLILPTESIELHNSNVRAAHASSNIEHVQEKVSRAEWNKYIAESRFVVVPIIPGTIQPAGISVYLEAMALAKPVVITHGAATRNLLDESLAVLVRAGDVDEMRRAVLRLWSDRSARDRLAQNGREYARSLGDHDRLLADIRKLCSSVLAAAN